jgi:aryl-alcohol dehydrogenase-like predicted oxidoreductase
MLARPIPSTGENLPVVGLGTWQAFDVGTSDRERAAQREVLARFVAQGGALVDSSPMYGRSEAVVGDLVVELSLRDRLFIATKVWTSGRDAGVRQIAASFSKLRVDRLDLVQVHNLVDAATHLGTLREIKAQGRLRYLGVTHYQASAHDALQRHVETRSVEFVQVNYSVAEPEAERALLDAARANGVAVIANRPFGGGSLARRLASRPLPSFASALGCTTWPQLLLKFVLAHPAVTCVIPATANAAHLVDNLAAGREPLPDAAMRVRIADAAR